MGRPKKISTDPKKIKIKEARIPLQKLINGKEIRQAAKNLEDFRLKFKEEEILYGATLTIKYDTWDRSFRVVAERLETSEETTERVEKERLAEEAKKRREAERKAKEAEEAKRREEARINRVLQELREHAKAHNIPMDILVDSLKS